MSLYEFCDVRREIGMACSGRRGGARPIRSMRNLQVSFLAREFMLARLPFTLGPS